jgi:hypothetical protein
MLLFSVDVVVTLLGGIETVANLVGNVLKGSFPKSPPTSYAIIVRRQAHWSNMSEAQMALRG